VVDYDLIIEALEDLKSIVENLKEEHEANKRDEDLQAAPNRLGEVLTSFTLSYAKSFDTPGTWEYDKAHREVATDEQQNPCTCQRKAKERTGSAMYPSLITREDADPDCELHFPWMIEDDKSRVLAMRWWFAGHQVGYNTASATDG